MTAVKSHYILYYVERTGYECRDCSTVQLGYFKKDETVYLAIIKRLHVGIIKKKMSSLLSHKVEVEPGDFAAISEEKYHAIKKCRIENNISGPRRISRSFSKVPKNQNLRFLVKRYQSWNLLSNTCFKKSKAR